MLKSDDIKLGESIAKSIRERNGGLLGVQAMAFPHDNNQTEIACNVDLVFVGNDPSKKIQLAIAQGTLVHCMGQYYMTPFSNIYQEIQRKANASGFSLSANSVVIGFTPQEACRITEEALKMGNSWVVGHERNNKHM